MKCFVCGTELTFVKYGEKMGKDGRMAKWPIYEPCPNKANHKELNKTLVIPEATKPVVVKAPDRPPVAVSTKIIMPRISGTLFQFQTAICMTEFNIMLHAYKAKHFGAEPLEIRVDEQVYDILADQLLEKGVQIPVVVDTSLTPRYKYLVMVEKRHA